MGVTAKMKYMDIGVDFGEVKSDRMINFIDRIRYIKYWVSYIKTHPVAEWSKGQADFIDAQFQSAEIFWRELREKDPEKYEKMKRLRLKILPGFVKAKSLGI